MSPLKEICNQSVQGWPLQRSEYIHFPSIGSPHSLFSWSHLSRLAPNYQWSYSDLPAAHFSVCCYVGLRVLIHFRALLWDFLDNCPLQTGFPSGVNGNLRFPFVLRSAQINWRLHGCLSLCCLSSKPALRVTGHPVHLPVASQPTLRCREGRQAHPQDNLPLHSRHLPLRAHCLHFVSCWIFCVCQLPRGGYISLAKGGRSSDAHLLTLYHFDWFLR